jgi:hypothetical protein
MVGWFPNVEMEGCGRRWLWLYTKLCPEILRNATENESKELTGLEAEIRISESSEYEAEMLTTSLRLSVK